MNHPSPDATRTSAASGPVSFVRGFLLRAVLIVSALTIAGSVMILGVFIFFPTTAEEFTAGLRPSLFYVPLPPELIADDLEDDYARVFGVAHNSGDTIPATLAALASGADAIEIDVVSLDGELYSSHAPPPPVIGTAVFRGPSLEAVWTAAAQTDLVKFDLKESSPEFLELVYEFIVTHQDDQQIIVATDDPASHRYFADRMPELLLFHSIGERGDVTSLQENPELVAILDGVSIRNELVDEETIRWMKEHELRMLVWTVNNLARTNELIRLGIEAITTDNMALLGLFGGQTRGEESLEPREATPDFAPIAAPDATPQPAGVARAPHARGARPGGAGGWRGRTSSSIWPSDPGGRSHDRHQVRSLHMTLSSFHSPSPLLKSLGRDADLDDYREMTQEARRTTGRRPCLYALIGVA